MSQEKFQSCIDACRACAIACDRCATACLHEDNLKMMVKCIHLDRECAEICSSAVRVMSMGGKFSPEICQICEDICEACASECEKHAEMEHCKECAEACRTCAEECREMASVNYTII